MNMKLSCSYRPVNTELHNSGREELLARVHEALRMAELLRATRGGVSERTMWWAMTQIVADLQEAADLLRGREDEVR
jgi:hypothetical protein